MSRYRRVNIDGDSLFKTETRIMAAALLPGTFVVIDVNGEFAVAPSGTVGRLYVLDAAHHEGLAIRDAVPADHSGIGNYVEEGREFAVLVPAGTYRKDEPVSVGASGRGVSGTTNVIGWCQDDAMLAAEDFVRVRMRTVLNTAAVASVEVLPATASIDLSEGETVQLTATVAPGNAPNGINWTTSNAGVATVSATGLVTPVSAGSATITATSQANGAVTDTCAVTVTA